MESNHQNSQDKIDNQRKEHNKHEDNSSSATKAIIEFFHNLPKEKG